MIRYEDNCVGCDSGRFSCQGPNCPLKRYEVHSCDICGEEGELYSIENIIDGDDNEYCYDHAKEEITKYVKELYPEEDEDEIDEISSSLFVDKAKRC